jgi:hypothetical protein
VELAVRRADVTLAALLMLLVGSGVAGAQTSPPPAAEAAPAAAKPPSPHSSYWLVGGAGFAGARTGCPDCGSEGVSTSGPSILFDVGKRVNSRLDVGIEVVWGNSKVAENEEPTRTTFVMGIVQVRPWHTRGFFFKTGMGSGVVGNLQGPIGEELEGTHTTNTMALVYGAGWVFQREKRFSMQVHGTHHVAALGDVKIKDGATLQNVLNNYWTVLVGIVFR